MKIQTPNTRRNWFSKSSGKCKFFIAIFILVGYSGFVFLTGGIAHQKGFFGKVLKPIIMENVRIPINYVKGLTSKPEHIILDIKHMDFQKLAYKRELAMSEGVLHSTSEDYVSAKIRWQGKTIPVKVRLKGDLADHWSDDSKWSFRIKTKGDRTVLGMKKFSLQHPRTRGFLNDWYLHQLLAYMGNFIVLRYDFVTLTLNGKELGIYLMEEHFEEMLLKNNNRLNAPIVRIYDHLLWYNIDPEVGFSRSHLNEHYTLSPIDTFNSGTISRDESLLKEFNQAKNLFESFRQGKLSTHEVFDIDKLAEVCAVIDLLGYHHTTAYSNIRFYYDPVSSHLIPIGYDNTFIIPATSIHGQWKRLKGVTASPVSYFSPQHEQIWYNNIFADKVFFEKYIKALEKVAKKQFLDDFFTETDKDYHRMLNLLYRTFPGYRFPHRETIYDNQEYIRNIIDPLQAIQAYFKSFNRENNSIFLELGNIQSLPVEIINISYGNNTLPADQNEILLQAKGHHQFVDFQSFEFHIPKDLMWDNSMTENLTVTYRILGANEHKTAMVYPWSHLDNDFPEKDFLRRPANHFSFPFLDIDESRKMISIKPGKWNLDKDLIIPEGYSFKCTAGTSLTLRNGSIILSHSPLIFKGGLDKPITVRNSEDNPGQGIVVLQAGEKSLISHVIFQRLSQSNKGDWSVPAGVIFYESPVDIDNCTFVDSIGINSLSIIRSVFSFSNSHIAICEGNGVDITYGDGTISNVCISKCNGNALNITGSRVDLHDILLQDIAGRALSCREKSMVSINGMETHKALIGIDLTDSSRIKGENIILADGKLGVAVYRNNREYGLSELFIQGLTSRNLEQNYYVDKNSVLSIDGQQAQTSMKNPESFIKASDG